MSGTTGAEWKSPAQTRRSSRASIWSRWRLALSVAPGGALQREHGALKWHSLKALSGSSTPFERRRHPFAAEASVSPTISVPILLCVTYLRREPDSGQLQTFNVGSGLKRARFHFSQQVKIIYKPLKSRDGHQIDRASKGGRQLTGSAKAPLVSHYIWRILRNPN